MASDRDDGAQASEVFSIEAATALIAQLYYDRADVARISDAAASAMDVVIVLVKDAISAHVPASAEDAGRR